KRLLLLDVSSRKHNGFAQATPSDISHTANPAIAHGELAQLDDRVRFKTVPRMACWTMPIKIPSGKAAFIAAVFLGLRQQGADLLRDVRRLRRPLLPHGP